MRLPAPALAAVAVLALAFAWLGSAAAPRAPRNEGPVWRLREGRLLYRFHGTFRTEALFDLRVDPLETRDVSREHPETLERLRAAFLRYVGARTLEEAPASGEEWRRAMEGVGYVGPPPAEGK